MVIFLNLLHCIFSFSLISSSSTTSMYKISLPCSIVIRLIMSLFGCTMLYPPLRKSLNPPLLCLGPPHPYFGFSSIKTQLLIQLPFPISFVWMALSTISSRQSVTLDPGCLVTPSGGRKRIQVMLDNISSSLLSILSQF